MRTVISKLQPSGRNLAHFQSDSCNELTVEEDPKYFGTWSHDATSIQFPINCVFFWLLMNVLTWSKRVLE